MPSTFNAVEIIKHKRDGGPLSADQIRWFIDAYTKGDVADEQASALLMAIVWRGMTDEELDVWTDAMIESGERLDLSSIDRPTSDKHSTGGVGDKVSLVLAPLVAACGVADPMLSGRGLGHTGGTLDKLESITGFRTDLSGDEMLSVLKEVGCVITAASASLAPADRKLYALRDVTGTVESIPLIASSIMSKKIAEGTQSLVLDVKVGRGAFMKRIDDSRELAERMVQIGSSEGVKTSALLTDMDAPLGRTAGNAIEVAESLETLNGSGPDDLREITLALAREMLDLAGVDADPEVALKDGSARKKFDAMVEAQAGDPSAPLPVASERRLVPARSKGFIARLDAHDVGVAAWRLGAGRSLKEHPVSPVAGVVLLKKPGEGVEKGEPVLELHAEDGSRFSPAEEALKNAIEIATEPPEPRPLVIDRIA
jgi:thymidine phosphorylase